MDANESVKVTIGHFSDGNVLLQNMLPAAFPVLYPERMAGFVSKQLVAGNTITETIQRKRLL